MIWQPLSTDLTLTLTEGEVHLWRANLDCNPEKIQELAKILSADEKARAERFYFPQHRQRFTVARGILRFILGRYLAIAPEKLQFAYSSRGKPRLEASCDGNWLQFNLSHSQGLALYGMVRDRRIGVDVEYLRPMADAEQLARRFYSTRESAVLNALPPPEREIAFFRGWTAKEAYLKAVGEGLGGGLAEVEVSLAPNCPLRLLAIGSDVQAASQWKLAGLTPHPNYLAAVAVEGYDWHLQCWQG